MFTSRGFGAMASTALILVLAKPADGLAQYRINERINERTNALPRPPMRTYRPGVIVGPIAGPPPAAANRIGDRDGRIVDRDNRIVDHDSRIRNHDDRIRDHDGEHGAFAAGVAAGIVLGGAAAAPDIYSEPAPSPEDDPVAYCARMYSSYDPQSGTYMGNDANPHPCP
jgi:BA14K-like protein